ncbi:Tetratricopeptide repeat protein 28 [Trichoplax sp. H2]|nr:Tetratricopeptide repeat protein 28 [Trichoplax sp. H2]|eukprot:RDD40113.1 Tetratricopeptide repeat protein 28 [Trichoplax sp. H2]
MANQDENVAQILQQINHHVQFYHQNPSSSFQQFHQQHTQLLHQLWDLRLVYVDRPLSIIKTLLNMLVTSIKNGIALSHWWVYPTLHRSRLIILDNLLHHNQLDWYQCHDIVLLLQQAIANCNRHICKSIRHLSPVIPYYCIMMELILMKDLLTDQSYVHNDFIIHLCRSYHKYQDLLLLNNDSFFLIEYLKILSHPGNTQFKNCYIALDMLATLIRSNHCTNPMREIAYFGYESIQAYCCQDYLGFRDIFLAYIQKATHSRCFDIILQKWLEECRSIITVENMSERIKDSIKHVLCHHQQFYSTRISDYFHQGNLDMQTFLHHNLSDFNTIDHPTIKSSCSVTDQLPLLHTITFPIATIIALPSNQPNDLINRHSLLQDITDRFSSNIWKLDKINLVALKGISGCGKSCIALNYARQYQKQYQLIYWFNAETEIAVQNGILKLAYDLYECALCHGYTHTREMMRLQRLLEIYQQASSTYDNILIDTIININRDQYHTNLQVMKKIILATFDILNVHFKYLLIYDNASDHVLLNPYLPTKGQGNIIITTPNVRWPNAMIIPSFDRDMSLQCITQLSGQNDSISANKIADLTTDLPLAIRMTIAYLTVNQLSLKEFIEIYERESCKITVDILYSNHQQHNHNSHTNNATQDNAQIHDQFNPYIATLCNMMLTKITDHQFLINPILQFMMYSSSELLSASLLEDYVNYKSDSPELLHKPIQILLNYAILMEINGDYTMPNVIKQTLQHLFRSKDVLDNSVLKFFNQQMDLDYFDALCWKRWKIIASHIETALLFVRDSKHQANITASLYCKLGKIYFLNGSFNKANSFFKKSLDVYVSYYGGHSLDIASYKGYIGLASYALGKYNDAEDYLKTSLGILKQLDDEHYVDLAAVYNRLSLVHFAAKQFSEAANYCDLATQIVMKHSGEDTIDYAVCCHNLGCLYSEMYDYYSALKIHKKALKIFQLRLKKVSLWTAITHNSIAAILKQYGKYENALKHYDDALDISIKLFGLRSQLVADCYNNIGMILRCQGRYDEALDNHWNALQNQIVTCKEGSLAVVKSYCYIGNTYCALGKHKIATSYFKRAKAITNKLNQRQTEEYAEICGCLGNINGMQGKYNQAVNHYQAALNIYKTNCGENSLKTAASYSGLGMIFCCQRKFDDAIDHLNKSLDIKIRLVGEDSLEASMGNTNLGYVSICQLNFQQARQYLEKSLEIILKIRGQCSLDTTIVYDNLALFFKAQNKYDDAIQYYQKSAKTRKRLFGLYHVTIARNYYDLGRLYKQSGDRLKASECFKAALEVCSQCIGTGQYLGKKIAKALTF